MNQEIIWIDLQGVNCYLGKTEQGFILFDTAGHLVLDKEFNNRREALEERLKKEGVNAGNLKVIVLTHGDSDHSANAAYLRDKYHCAIAMHAQDVSLVENASLDQWMESFRYRSIAFKVIFRLLNRKIRAVTEKVLKEFEEFSPDVLLKEGDGLSEYGFAARIVHLPGHTPGSIGILCEGGELIIGDTYTNIKKVTPAPNAADFSLLHKSIEKIKKMKITTVYPGHGKPFSCIP